VLSSLCNNIKLGESRDMVSVSWSGSVIFKTPNLTKFQEVKRLVAEYTAEDEIIYSCAQELYQEQLRNLIW
jgi:hypothetical protein